MSFQKKLFTELLIADAVGCAIIVSLVSYFFPKNMIVQIISVAATIFVTTLIVTYSHKKRKEKGKKDN